MANPDSDRIRRRMLSVPTVVVGFLVTVILAPISFPMAFVVDLGRWLLSRRPFMAVRLVLFLVVYLGAETLGLVALATGWVWSGFGRNRPRLGKVTFAVQRAWAGALLTVVERLFRLSFTVTGSEVLADPPFLIFARHASIVDNLLANRYLSIPHGTRIRYVLKDELRFDPALDIAGTWLPNVFVRRGSGDSERETAAIARLGATAGPNEAVLIYPEGSRFDGEKLRAAQSRLERSGSRWAANAATLQSVLPPRPGGAVALLGATASDVVVMAHRGLDGFARVADIWRGSMVDRDVVVAFWRIERTAIPEERSERIDWLFDLWTDIDAWITEGTSRSEKE